MVVILTRIVSMVVGIPGVLYEGVLFFLNFLCLIAEIWFKKKLVPSTLAWPFPANVCFLRQPGINKIEKMNLVTKRTTSCSSKWAHTSQICLRSVNKNATQMTVDTQPNHWWTNTWKLESLQQKSADRQQTTVRVERCYWSLKNIHQNQKAWQRTNKKTRFVFIPWETSVVFSL